MMQVCTIKMKSIFSYYVVVMILLPSVHLWTPKRNSKPSPVCRSKECRERGQWYYANLNSDVHPCDDFYEYACGFWSQAHPRPSFALEWNIEDVMNDRAFVQIRKLLRQPVLRDDTILNRRAKAAYKFCVNKPSLSRTKIDIVLKHIKDVGVAEAQLPWAFHDTYLQRTGQSSFFDYSVLVNERDDYRLVIQLKELPTPYGSIMHLPDWTPKETSNYEEFLMDIYKGLATVDNSYLDEAEAKQQVKRVVALRHEMNKLIHHQIQLPDDKFEPMTVTDIQNWYTQVIRPTTRNLLNWKSIAKILFPSVSSDMFKTKKIFSLRRKEYFLELANILRNVPIETINKHIEMFFIERHLLYSDRMEEKLRRTFGSTAQHKGYLFESAPRWISCIQNHNMPHVLGRMYVNSFFDNKTVQPVKELIARLKDTIIQQVRESPWLNTQMKLKVAQHLGEVRSAIGFPTWYGNPRESNRPADPSPLTSNAQFDTVHDVIYLTAAFLRSPIFDKAMPSVLNIGALGYSIGLQLYHVFGDCGRYPKTEEKMPLWTQEAMYKCEEVRQEFIEELKRYTSNELKNVLNDEIVVTTDSLIEDMMAVMGLKAAYRYFIHHTRNDRCEVVPQFEDFTCEQVFFIAFANTMCGHENLHLLSANYRAMSNNIRRIRVNSAVMHNKYFSTAFQCGMGSPMNPRTKMDLWK